MYTYEHPRPSLTVDVAIFAIRDEQLNVLLVQRAHSPFQGRWALPGGFVEMDEPLEHAAARELEEETGVDNAYLEQLYTYGDPGRDPRGRVVSVAYFALLPYNSLHQGEAGSDAAQVGWFPVEAVPELAFDHTEILDYATHRLRYKLETSAVGFQLMPDEFTLSELQHIYEVVLGAKQEPRSFQRHMQKAGFIRIHHACTQRQRPPGEIVSLQTRGSGGSKNSTVLPVNVIK